MTRAEKCSCRLSATSQTPCDAQSRLASSNVPRGIITPVGLPRMQKR